MTRTAQNMMNIVKEMIANLRRSGRMLGFLSAYGRTISPTIPSVGSVTPATIGWK